MMLEMEREELGVLRRALEARVRDMLPCTMVLGFELPISACAS